MYQPLIKFHPHPAIITQVLRIFVANGKENSYIIDCERTALLVLFILLYKLHGQKQKQETIG